MAKKGERDSAEYIASMCNELAELAERSGFDTGAYLLKIAAVEFVDREARSERRARK